MIIIGEVMEDLMGDRFKSRYKVNEAYCRGPKELIRKLSQSEILVGTESKFTSSYLLLFI